MSEALEKQVADILQRGDAFVTSNYPDLVRGIINYGLADNLIWAMISLFIFCVALYALVKLIREFKEEGAGIVDYEVLTGLTLVNLFVVFISFLVFLCSFGNIIRILLAPELYVLQTVLKLVNP